MNNKITTAEAFNHLKNALQEDKDYAWSWHCNLAMAYYDEEATHEQANKAAARFMNWCFGIDMTKHPFYDYKEGRQVQVRGREKELVKYKHVRDPWGTMVGTICFCTDPKEDKKIYVGVSICADTDNFSRKVGRELAFERAVLAFENQGNSLPIKEVSTRNASIMENEPILSKNPYLSFCFTHEG